MYVCVFIGEGSNLKRRDYKPCGRKNLSLFKCKHCVIARSARGLCVLADLDFIMSPFPIAL